jgi:hypothetical protein
LNNTSPACAVKPARFLLSAQFVFRALAGERYQFAAVRSGKNLSRLSAYLACHWSPVFAV